MKSIFCALLALGISSNVCGQQNTVSTFPAWGAEGMALSNQEVATYSTQALQGSGVAANRLGMHFLGARGNRQLAEYWYLISAENGDAGGQLGYGSMILEDSSENKTRAIFWLEKSASQGNDYARRRLEHIAH